MIKYIYIYIIITIVLLSIYVFKSKKEPFENNNKPVVFELNKRAGFFSIFFFLCDAYIYAKKHNHPFYIIDNGWTYTYKKGWHDYFTSLQVYTGKLEDAIVVDRDITKNIPGANQNETNTVQDYIDAINEIFQLNNDITEKYKLEQAKLGNDYISIYIRRGDKISWGESELVNLDKLIQQLGIVDTKTTAFVQTDDYAAINELKQLLPQATIQTLTPDSKKGSTEQDLQKMNKEDMYKDTIELLIACLCSANATKAYIDTQSNVGRFIKLYSFDKNNVIGYPIGNSSGNYLQLNSKIESPAYKFKLAS